MSAHTKANVCVARYVSILSSMAAAPVTKRICICICLELNLHVSSSLSLHSSRFLSGFLSVSLRRNSDFSATPPGIHFGFASDDVIAIPLRCRKELTSIPLRSHFGFTSRSFLFIWVFSSMSHRSFGSTMLPCNSMSLSHGIDSIFHFDTIAVSSTSFSFPIQSSITPI